MSGVLSLSLILSIAGCLVGLAGIVLAVYYYRKSQRTKRLAFDTRAFGLISNTAASLPGLHVSYRDQEFRALTAAKILLVNSGTEMVQGSDIADADPISFRLPDDSEILSATMSFVSDPTNQLRLESPDASRNVLRVTFDYLAPRQGCVILLLHNGMQDTPILSGGTLKGVGPPSPYVSPPSRFPVGRMVALATILVGSAFLIAPLKAYFDAPTASLAARSASYSLAVISGLLLAAVGVEMVVMMLFRPARASVLDRNFTHRFRVGDFTHPLPEDLTL
jgi:hypothetical protein